MKYMPQSVFDYGALSLAMTAYRGGDVLAGVTDIASSYERHYLDQGLAREWLLAAQGIQKLLPTLFLQPGMDNAKLAGACKSLAEAVEEYEPTGRRRPRWLRGTLFSGEKGPVRDKVHVCLANVQLYHLGIVSGRMKVGHRDGSNRGWLKYFAQLLAAVAAYSAAAHLFNPLPRPDVRPGEEYLVYAMAYPTYFLALYIPLALLGLIGTKVVPIARRTPIARVLSIMLVPALAVWALLILGGWYGDMRAAGFRPF